MSSHPKDKHLEHCESAAVPLLISTHLTAWTVMTWLWRTLLNSLLTNLRRKENMPRKLWSCRTNEVAESSFKRRSRNWTMMSESVLNTEWVCITLGKECQSATTGTTHSGPWQKRSPPVRLYGDSLSERGGEIHQRPAWPPNQPVQDGGPWIWHGRGSLWQAHP